MYARARLMSEAAVGPTASTRIVSSLVAIARCNGAQRLVFTSDVAAVITRRPMSLVSCRTAPTQASWEKKALNGIMAWRARYRFDWADSESVAASAVGSNCDPSMTVGLLISMLQPSSATVISSHRAVLII
jgi:hypothetical protein